MQSWKGGRNDLPSQDTHGVSAETGLSETRVLSSAGGYQRALPSVCPYVP